MIRRRTKKIKTPNKATVPSQPKPAQPDELTFLEHVYELRSRLFWITVSLIVTSAIGFQYKDILVSFIMAPLHGEKLVYLTPGGGFSFIFTICLYFGALLTIPVIMYHIYRFLQPVLGKTSRRFIALILLVSTSLAVGGAVFGYVVAIPAAIQFLSTFAGDAVTPNLTAESYLGFVVAYMLGLAALFQLPLLLYIIDHIRPFPPGTLLTSQRFVIVGAVIAAAIITPTPDAVNQLIVAGPIIAIYQLGAIAVYVRHKAMQRRRPRMEHAALPAPSVPDIQAPIVESTSHHSLPSLPLASHTIPAVEMPLSASDARSAARLTPSRKSLDGVTRPKQPVAVPSRQMQQASEPLRRPLRSIDGIVA